MRKQAGAARRRQANSRAVCAIGTRQNSRTKAPPRAEQRRTRSPHHPSLFRPPRRIRHTLCTCHCICGALSLAFHQLVMAFANACHCLCGSVPPPAEIGCHVSEEGRRRVASAYHLLYRNLSPPFRDFANYCATTFHPGSFDTELLTSVSARATYLELS